MGFVNEWHASPGVFAFEDWAIQHSGDCGLCHRPSTLDFRNVAQRAGQVAQSLDPGFNSVKSSINRFHRGFDGLKSGIGISYC